MRLAGVIDPDFLGELQSEIRSNVEWRDAGVEFVNRRGVRIVQNHDVHAVLLPDDGLAARLPLMSELTLAVEGCVQSLGSSSSQLRTLAGWRATETSYHKYRLDQESDGTGLSFHRDNVEFEGVVAVAGIAGTRLFRVVDRDPVEESRTDGGEITEWTTRATHTIPTGPGDLLLMRATGLVSGSDEYRPEHGIYGDSTTEGTGAISMMVRSNPSGKPLPGFTYDNTS